MTTGSNARADAARRIGLVLEAVYQFVLWLVPTVNDPAACPAGRAVEV